MEKKVNMDNSMNAIREIVKPKNKKIIVDLGDDFSDEYEYEVIIFPIKNKKKIHNKNRRDLYGKYKGQIWMSDDFNEPLEDFEEYMD